MDAIKRLTARFESWTGYCEKRSASQLDDFTANAGSNNYTCFGRDYTKLVNDGYDWNGEPWCDEYIDVNFVYEFGKETAKKLLGGFSAYTPASAQYFKNMGRWHTSNPREGDIIFFRNSSGICHTGYVRGNDGVYVYTNEGNTSASSGVVANGGCVANKKYSLSYSKIAGYGRPDYSIVEEELTMAQYEELNAKITGLNDTINKLTNKINNLENEQTKLSMSVGGTFIYNYIDKNMPEWAREGVKWCVDKGVINGTGIDENGTVMLGLNYMQMWMCVVVCRLAKLFIK